MIKWLNELNGIYVTLAEIFLWLYVVLICLIVLILFIFILAILWDCICNIMIVYNQAYENIDKVEKWKGKKSMLI